MTLETKVRIARIETLVDCYGKSQDAKALRDLLAAAEAGAQWKRERDEARRELEGERDVRRRIEQHNHDLQRAVASRPSRDEWTDRELSRGHFRSAPLDDRVDSGCGGEASGGLELAFRNLVARINGDGGHRQAEFATAQEAGADAQQRVIAILIRAETAEAELARLRPLAEAGARLKAERDRLLNALFDFGAHDSECGIRTGSDGKREVTDDCTCGLEELETWVECLLPAEAPVYPRMHHTSATYAPVDPEDVADALGAVPAEAPAPTKEEQ